MSMKYKYYICDVFTSQRFGGNPLAVLPDAEGLSSEQMQQIAREFNFSESTFVFAAEHDNTKKVRIFTPSAEVPFAGHPNIGTAFVLATTGELDDFSDSADIVFEEQAGLVPIKMSKVQGKIQSELKAPEALSFGLKVSRELAAFALSIDESEIVMATHDPQVTSVGLPFLIVELKSVSALSGAKINIEGFEKILAMGITPFIHIYVRCDDDFDIRARMFAPTDGVPEDPATGSANCALAALLAYYDEQADGEFNWTIAQGVEMGRPSVLNARALKKSGTVEDSFIGGSCVMVSEGIIFV
jgi:trans-2,3-dihydro-3-hydroxyanthranilate isomerase